MDFVVIRLEALQGDQWPKALKRKLENGSGQPGDLLKYRHSDSLKAKLNFLFLWEC
jgi:hypothetical protein